MAWINGHEIPFGIISETSTPKISTSGDMVLIAKGIGVKSIVGIAEQVEEPQTEGD